MRRYSRRIRLIMQIPYRQTVGAAPLSGKPSEIQRRAFLARALVCAGIRRHCFHMATVNRGLSVSGPEGSRPTLVTVRVCVRDVIHRMPDCGTWLYNLLFQPTLVRPAKDEPAIESTICAPVHSHGVSVCVRWAATTGDWAGLYFAFSREAAITVSGVFASDSRLPEAETEAG
jgi:hypothetical protein